MQYNDDENDSPSEFYYPEQTNDPKNTAERLAVKAFFGLSYKVTTNCNPTKPYNKSLINLVCSVCTESIAFGFYRTALAPSSLNLYEKPQAILSRTDLPLG